MSVHLSTPLNSGDTSNLTRAWLSGWALALRAAPVLVLVALLSLICVIGMLLPGAFRKCEVLTDKTCELIARLSRVDDISAPTADPSPAQTPGPPAKAQAHFSSRERRRL